MAMKYTAGSKRYIAYVYHVSFKEYPNLSSSYCIINSLMGALGKRNIQYATRLLDRPYQSTPIEEHILFQSKYAGCMLHKNIISDSLQDHTGVANALLVIFNETLINNSNF